MNTKKRGICQVPDCDRLTAAHGLCNTHYHRKRAHGDPNICLRSAVGVCSVEGCDNKHRCKGLCGKHYGRLRKHGDPNVLTVEQHHMLRTPEYRAWQGIKRRTMDTQNPAYPRYGGRGIQMSSVWQKSFLRFFADVGPRPSPEHSIDRIDNDGNYERGNIRWATRIQQCRNKSSNNVLAIDGQQQCLKAWSEVSGINAITIGQRLRKGWTPKEAVFTPLLKAGTR